MDEDCPEYCWLSTAKCNSLCRLEAVTCLEEACIYCKLRLMTVLYHMTDLLYQTHN